MAKCKFCSREITWIREGRRSRPIDGDGGVHSCDEMKKSMKTIKSMGRDSLSAEDIAKYEAAINATKK